MQVSTNVKIAMQCFENFWGGGNAPNALPWLRAWRRTYVIVVRWNDELCGGYKWVSRFETPSIRTRWTGERWVEQVSRLHVTACYRGNLDPLRRCPSGTLIAAHLEHISCTKRTSQAFHCKLRSTPSQGNYWTVRFLPLDRSENQLSTLKWVTQYQSASPHVVFIDLSKQHAWFPQEYVKTFSTHTGKIGIH